MQQSDYKTIEGKLNELNPAAIQNTELFNNSFSYKERKVFMKAFNLIKKTGQYYLASVQCDQAGVRLQLMGKEGIDDLAVPGVCFFIKIYTYPDTLSQAVKYALYLTRKFGTTRREVTNV
jgi:hypothetical protein